jgi:hypothetical protein
MADWGNGMEIKKSSLAFDHISLTFITLLTQITVMRKMIWSIVLILLVLGAGFIYWKFYFVFGEGAKAGELNFLVKKGYVFKTWEGKLIQSGLRSKAANTVQSYDFDFSVTDEAVAQKLLSSEGKIFNLHYKEYMGALPWRGYSKYVVDSIISITDLSH